MSDDLVAFLNARLDYLERAARTALVGDAWAKVLGSLAPSGHEFVVQELMRHNDPARVLREVAADRAILAEHAKAERAYRQARDEHARDLTPGRADTQLASSVALDKLMVWERVLHHRATVWSDHPDYRPA